MLSRVLSRFQPLVRKPATLQSTHSRKRDPLSNLASFSTSRAQCKSNHGQQPNGPFGVDAVIEAASDPDFTPRPRIFDEFSLADRVAVVTGANRGLSLEIALALAEAGSRVWCLDLPKQPGEQWLACHRFVDKLGNHSKLAYMCADVRDQEKVWKLFEEIANKEGRMDICVAGAGVLRPEIDCLEYPAKDYREVFEVNTDGVLFTAQAAGRQMRRFGTPGSIIMIGSCAAIVANKGHPCVSYNTSKAAVLQMVRSMSSELGADGIRVNSISPGYINTKMTSDRIKERPEMLEKWSSLAHLGRIGRPDELRGVVTWLASDASSFCTGSNIVVDGGFTAW